MSQHTRGPWVITWDEGGKESEIRRPRGHTFLHEPICIIPHDDITEDGDVEMRANAALIQSAPDLLEALELMLERAPSMDGEAIDKARAAIAKATQATAGGES